MREVREALGKRIEKHDPQCDRREQEAKRIQRPRREDDVTKIANVQVVRNKRPFFKGVDRGLARFGKSA
jgi:hypothetical protein